MNLLLIPSEKEELVMGVPTDFDIRNNLVDRNYIHKDVNGKTVSFLRKTYVNHYILIKDFNTFMFNQTKHKEKKNFCMYCLQQFSTLEVLNKHKTDCMVINGKQAIEMPKKGKNILKYKHFEKQMPVPFVIYADLEAITEKVQGCQMSGNKSFTQSYQKHTDFGYGYKVVFCYDNKHSKPVEIYRGENAVYNFLEKMLEEVQYCK